VRAAHYGQELTTQAGASAQACISRARRGLIKRGLIEDQRGIFTLTLAGWDVADALVLAREKAPEVIANEEDRFLSADHLFSHYAWSVSDAVEYNRRIKIHNQREGRSETYYPLQDWLASL
jgi:hypothetical protein